MKRARARAAGAAFVLTLAAATARAQSSTKRPSEIALTPESAAVVALDRSPALKAARAKARAETAAARAAGVPENPTLSGAYKAGSRWGQTDLELSFDLWSLIGAGHRRRAGEAASRQAEAVLAEEALALTEDAKSAVYAVEAASATLILRRELAVTARAAADRARGNERDQEAAAAGQAGLDADRAEGMLAAARSELARLLRVPTDSGWWTEAVLPDPPAGDPDPAAAAALATERRPARGAALAAARAAEQSARSWSTASAGEMRLGIAAERQPDGRRFAGPSVELELPVFDATRPGLEASRARADEAAARAEQEDADLTAELETLRARLAAARKAAARLGVEIVPARARIAAASGRMSDRQAETDARAALVEALRDYWTTLAAFERAVGGSLP